MRIFLLSVISFLPIMAGAQNVLLPGNGKPVLVSMSGKVLGDLLTGPDDPWRGGWMLLRWSGRTIGLPVVVTGENAGVRGFYRPLSDYPQVWSGTSCDGDPLIGYSFDPNTVVRLGILPGIFIGNEGAVGQIAVADALVFEEFQSWSIGTPDSCILENTGTIVAYRARTRFAWPHVKMYPKWVSVMSDSSGR